MGLVGSYVPGQSARSLTHIATLNAELYRCGRFAAWPYRNGWVARFGSDRRQKAAIRIELALHIPGRGLMKIESFHDLETGG